MKAGLGAARPGFQSWLCPQCPEGSWVSAFPSLGLHFPDFRREVGAKGQCPCLWLSASLQGTEDSSFPTSTKLAGTAPPLSGKTLSPAA